MTNRATHRFFVALTTPLEIRPRIAEIRNRLKESGADVKWEPGEKFHITLRFLGETDDRLLPEIVSSIEGVARTKDPFLLRYTGVGCFPDKRYPEVIWVGIEDMEGRLASLQQDIEDALLTTGVGRDEKVFRPHLTIGRVRGAGGIKGLLRMMESITFQSPPVMIREVAVIKSELKPGGSEYTILKSIPLNATGSQDH